MVFIPYPGCAVPSCKADEQGDDDADTCCPKYHSSPGYQPLPPKRQLIHRRLPHRRGAFLRGAAEPRQAIESLHWHVSPTTNLGRAGGVMSTSVAACRRSSHQMDGCGFGVEISSCTK